MREVTIIQRVLPHYRVHFIQKLAEALQSYNIRLQFIYGSEYPGTVPRTVFLDVPYVRWIANRYLKLGNTELVWQPCLDLVKKSKLVIFEPANRLPVNYALLLVKRIYGFKVGFWGHDRNLQSGRPGGPRERLKMLYSTSADWWFTYTSQRADAISRAGFNPRKITVVQNTIDNSELEKALKKLQMSVVYRIRERLGLKSVNIGLFCGGMYPEKDIAFLLECCLAIRQMVPDFQMLFVGNGPDQFLVEQAAATHPWIHYVGPKFGSARAPYFKMSKVFLMPGLVGLAIIDCFITGIPMFTTENTVHSPEVDYLENGVNGIMTLRSKDEFANAVAHFFNSEEMQDSLRKGCLISAAKYSMEKMVDNFARGVISCLSQA